MLKNILDSFFCILLYVYLTNQFEEKLASYSKIKDKGKKAYDFKGKYFLLDKLKVLLFDYFNSLVISQGFGKNNFTTHRTNFFVPSRNYQVINFI
jgi:hypothetical protein